MLMNTSMKRRVFLKGSLAAGAMGAAVGAGLLTPQAVLAAWPKDAFGAKKVEDALSALMGSASSTASGDIKVKAPDIAENGAVVPVTVSTTIAGVESIAILAEKNPVPLSASFDLGKGAEGFVSTRIKMGKTGDVIGVVKAGGKLYAARKGVKVTIGGCGG
jgi:sulfur-oxidizing protein SoxY